MGSSAMIAWLQFVACAAVIAFAGSHLSRYGDIIAEKTGLGGTWIGLVLLATVTSLPELVTGISSVAAADKPNIAVGDVLGSCVFNLLILTILDFMYREESVYRRASQGHILAAGFGIILIALIGFNLLISGNGAGLSIGHIGSYSFIVVAVYAIAMRTVFRYEQDHRAELTAALAGHYPDSSLASAARGYALSAIGVVCAGALLPFSAAQLASIMGWHTTFVGTLFVAFATSLPEVAVTLGALRIGSLDLAISNLLGSNLFNCVILAVDDSLFTRGPILAHVSQLHAVSAMSAIMMCGVVIVGLLYRPRARIFRTVGWSSLFLLTLYLLNSFVLYLYAE